LYSILSNSFSSVSLDIFAMDTRLRLCILSSRLALTALTCLTYKPNAAAAAASIIKSITAVFGTCFSVFSGSAVRGVFPLVTFTSEGRLIIEALPTDEVPELCRDDADDAPDDDETDEAHDDDETDEAVPDDDETAADDTADVGTADSAADPETETASGGDASRGSSMICFRGRYGKYTL